MTTQDPRTAPRPDAPDAEVPVAIGDVLAAIRDLAHGVDRYRLALSARHGLAVSEVITLAHLASTGSVRASDVAARTGLAQGSVTGLLDRLERRGYVERIRPPQNRRVVLVELTGPGRAVAEGMYAPVLPALVDAAAEPGAPDPQQMAHCMRRIAAILADLAGAPPEGAGPHGR